MEKVCTCIKDIGVWHSFEKNETATMFFLKKPSLVVKVNTLNLSYTVFRLARSLE